MPVPERDVVLSFGAGFFDLALRLAVDDFFRCLVVMFLGLYESVAHGNEQVQMQVQPAVDFLYAGDAERSSDTT